MTIAYERTRAIKYARDFLRELLIPEKTPRVPRAIRDRAYRVLRHFPGEADIRRLAGKCPDILGDDESWKK